jgi:hypothetical protein
MRENHHMSEAQYTNGGTEEVKPPTGLRPVKVLTLQAKCAVIVVGSRQVTMSVFNQLDIVEWEQMTPWGRVTPKETVDAFGHRVYWAVGRDGNEWLVRSTFRTPSPPPAADKKRYDELKASMVRLNRTRGDLAPHEKYILSDYEEQWDYYVTDKRVFDRRLAQWEQLYLIVLAGLR